MYVIARRRELRREQPTHRKVMSGDDPQVAVSRGRARFSGSSRFTAPRPPAKAPAEAAGPPWHARPGRCLPALPNPQQKWSRLQSATHLVPRPFLVTPSALLSSVLLSSLLDDLRAIGGARCAGLSGVGVVARESSSHKDLSAIQGVRRASFVSARRFDVSRIAASRVEGGARSQRYMLAIGKSRQSDGLSQGRRATIVG